MFPVYGNLLITSSTKKPDKTNRYKAQAEANKSKAPQSTCTESPLPRVTIHGRLKNWNKTKNHAMRSSVSQLNAIEALEQTTTQLRCDYLFIPAFYPFPCVTPDRFSE
jgi:hypothetical protein